jgi:RNA polymerase sigma factor (sigma-70 family)
MAFDSTLKDYLKQIDEVKLLSKEEEVQLALRIIEDNDPEARDILIRSNLRLVVKIAKDFAGRHLTFSDLIEEGNLGLMRAVDTFEPEYNVRFSTYAAWWIKQSIKRSLLLNAQPIHIPTYMVELINQFKHAKTELTAALGREPNVTEIAKSLDVPVRKATIINEIVATISSGGNVSGEQSEYGDVFDSVCDESAAQPYLNLLTDDETHKTLDLVGQLEPREARILTMRFGLDGCEPAETKEIAIELNLSTERVRQLQKQALKKLKEHLVYD